MLRAAGAAFAAIACFIAAPAYGAPVYVTVGQVAPGEASGGCSNCSTVQRASGTPGLYAFPYDGVLTRFTTRTGSSIAAIGGEWMRARTFRLGDATHATVMSESAQANITTPSTTMTFWDHVPAAAGDVLGAKWHTNPNIAETPTVFTTGTAAGDLTATDPSVPGPAVGQQMVGAAFGPSRVNISARLEHDSDRDSYGDGSQDLCLGDPARAITACSGTLFGSNLQGAYQRVGLGCDYACARVQLTHGGASTSPAADGVVVRWRLQNPNIGAYRIRILEPAVGGGYTVARSSGPVTIPADEALWTFPSRLPIRAGGYVALIPPPFTTQPSLLTPPAGASFTTVNDAPDGGSMPLTSSTLPNVALYNADIEPDADRDGFGDVTQDACPSNATTQGACPPPAATPPPPPAAPPPSAARPTAAPGAITAFSVRYARFRVLRGGAVAAATRAHAGTLLRITLSAGARVRFMIRRVRTGVRRNGVCKATTRAGSRRRCTIRRTIHRFDRNLAAGANAVAYSGRYRSRGRTRSLAAGRYRIEAAVVSAAGVAGTARARSVTVVR